MRVNGSREWQACSAGTPWRSRRGPGGRRQPPAAPPPPPAPWASAPAAPAPAPRTPAEGVLGSYGRRITASPPGQTDKCVADLWSRAASGTWPELPLIGPPGKLPRHLSTRASPVPPSSYIAIRQFLMLRTVTSLPFPLNSFTGRSPTGNRLAFNGEQEDFGGSPQNQCSAQSHVVIARVTR